MTGDVIRFMTGVRQLEGILPRGSPLMQFHKDDFQAVLGWFLAKELYFSEKKGSEAVPKFYGKMEK